MEGDLEEVPRDGETREAGAEDGVAQGAAAVPSCWRGRGRGRGGGGGSDSSPGEQTGRSRRKRGQHGVRRSGLDEKAAGGGSWLPAAVVERRAVRVRIFLFPPGMVRIWWAWRTLSP